MKFSAALATALFSSVILASPAAIDPKKKVDEATPSGTPPGKQLPPELTMETFDEFTGKSLTFVEFYSPYCSHCKQLAPKWKEAYFLTEEEQQHSNIHMRQVNCVESGDLCARENIAFFPNLRLYVPESSATAERKSRFVDSYPRSLSRTPQNFRKYLINSVAEYNAAALDIPSASVQLDIDLGMKVVAGDIEEPYFVALFSATDEQYASFKFPDNCKDCVEFKHLWDKLSNLIVTSSKSAHMNCHTHKAFCQKLGFPELTNPDKAKSPRFIMFVPKSAGLVRFDYTGNLVISELKRFATKLANNYKYEEVTARELEDLEVLRTELPESPPDLYYPLSNKMTLVFSYDKTTVTPEDKAIMPYLLEMVTKSPFDISLFASKSVKFEKTIEYQGKGLTQYVNSDKTFVDIPFNRPVHLATTLTAKPTLYIFKENSLIPVIYQNFALEDMRKADKIEDFLAKNLFPLYGEMTPKLFRQYFLRNKNKDNDKVVITFLNTDDATAIKNTMFNLSMVAHQYHTEKNKYYYEEVLKGRDEKSKTVAKMKADNSPTADIIQAMRELVPRLFDHNEVLFTYVDMVQYPEFADDYGLNIDGKTYKTGDTVVVSRDRTFYWDKDLQGNQLTSDRENLRKTLKYLLDPKLVPGVFRLKSKLVGSPYHRHLRGIDFIHQHGFFGYVLFFLFSFLFYQVVKKVMKTRTGSSTARRGGIIGDALSKSD